MRKSGKIMIKGQLKTDPNQYPLLKDEQQQGG
jgi:hypothetical protein